MTNLNHQIEGPLNIILLEEDNVQEDLDPKNSI